MERNLHDHCGREQPSWPCGLLARPSGRRSASRWMRRPRPGAPLGAPTSASCRSLAPQGRSRRLGPAAVALGNLSPDPRLVVPRRDRGGLGPHRRGSRGAAVVFVGAWRFFAYQADGSVASVTGPPATAGTAGGDRLGRGRGLRWARGLCYGERPDTSDLSSAVVTMPRRSGCRASRDPAPVTRLADILVAG